MIESIANTGSTNADLLERVRSAREVAEGDWLVADRQSAGRGRQGRQWLDGAGNFAGSTLVALRPNDPPPQTLAFLSAVAVHDALGAREDVRLKWPNDLMFGQAKIAGILLERLGQFVVIGVGVNLAELPSDLERKVALAPGNLDRDTFARRLDGCFSALLSRWHHEGDVAWLRREWLGRTFPLGTLLTAEHSQHGPVTGGFAGTAADFALLLRLADGEVHAIHAGDVGLVSED